MPFRFNTCDCSPLVIDEEFEITNETLLAEYVGKVILGHYVHVKRIINELSNNSLIVPNENIELAIKYLSSSDIEKRDGWIFQIISWLVLAINNKGMKYYSQQPHDAPAQHGIDGLGVLLNNDLTINRIIITEDKCTENQRVVIPKIWSEFEDFEKGVNDNKIVSRLSAMLENIDEGAVLEAIKNDLFSKDLRRYRVGINRDDKYQDLKKRKKLFKGYDSCIEDKDATRRYAATLHKNDIRNWMEQFTQIVIQFLESQKTANV